ncbi:hypothetical protein [Streptomyces sp. NPDC003717]|uniref:hypothetical protein n=1 Tax=Streptomyces sp. NPDC003717 TaxID=3154276 RepID=UPI0033B3E700
MVRRSQTSNPRASVVLTSGADWRTRAAGERRSSGAESPMPRRQPGKIKALRQTLDVLGVAINAKRWHEARYALSRAQALANALPADLISKERERLARLRKRFAARGAAPARSTKKTKAAQKPKQKRKPTPVRELGDRHIDRAALGYGSAERT